MPDVAIAIPEDIVAVVGGFLVIAFVFLLRSALATRPAPSVQRTVGGSLITAVRQESAAPPALEAGDATHVRGEIFREIAHSRIDDVREARPRLAE